MSSMNVSAGQKRKAQTSSRPLSADDRKRQKFQNAKIIAAQTADAAISKNGELNIASFIKAREYELNAMDKNIRKARQTLSTRAFQQVPRHLRRRTASHNAKKVPRRLRPRARREMIEDNTPTVTSRTRKPTSRLRLRLQTAKALKKLNDKRHTVRQKKKKKEAKANAIETDPAKHVDIARIPRLKKNQLAKTPLATSKFKRRQVHKTWLPTHLWHTKRAHMTLPTEPMWRMAIPLKPTEKCYRATHRALGARGCIAWDMSYVSTIGCLGTENSLQGMLKALGFHGHSWAGSKYVKWKAGCRFTTGWLYQRSTREALCEVEILWAASDKQKQDNASLRTQTGGDIEMLDETTNKKRGKTKLDQRIMIRIHPSAFHEVWTELLCAAKVQKPQVLIEDLRFEIGSIQVMGPGSTEALTAVLKVSEPNGYVAKLWNTLSALSNPSLLPMNVILSFNICDPRFIPPKEAETNPQSDESNSVLLETITEWELDSRMEPSALFSHANRHKASKLLSQWTINRRKQEQLPGQSLPTSLRGPPIPIVLLAHRPQRASTSQQGHWTILAPWKCIDVIWRRLLSSKLSSGSKPRFGGLREKRQMAFEESISWFPADFPGTQAGKAWERTQAQERFDAWIRSPPSRRIAWNSLDLGLGRRGELGRGWTCDWEFLLNDTGPKHSPTVPTDAKPSEDSAPTVRNPPKKSQQSATKFKADTNPEEVRRRNTSSPESDCLVDFDHIKEPNFVHTPLHEAGMALDAIHPSTPPARPSLVNIRLTFCGRGTPYAAARIYRIPKDDTLPGPIIPGNSSAVAQMSQTPISLTTSRQADTCDRCNLRQRWLAFDPGEHPHNLPLKFRKDKVNHRGLSRQAQHHNLESLRHINVIPKNAPSEIYEKYGPKPLSADEAKQLAEQQLIIHMEEQKIWESHVPCPDAEDLIGFVTSGGYNLSLGKGTAVGAIWLQRILEGSSHPCTQCSSTSASKSKGLSSHSHTGITKAHKKDRERHLCIVRNAGESIGRLAVWELC